MKYIVEYIVKVVLDKPESDVWSCRNIPKKEKLDNRDERVRRNEKSPLEKVE